MQFKISLRGKKYCLTCDKTVNNGQVRMFELSRDKQITIMHYCHVEENNTVTALLNVPGY